MIKYNNSNIDGNNHEYDSMIHRYEHDIRQLSFFIEQMETIANEIDGARGWKYLNRVEGILRSIILKPIRLNTVQKINNVCKHYRFFKHGKHTNIINYLNTGNVNFTSIINRTINRIPYTGDIDTPSLGPATKYYQNLYDNYLSRKQNKLVSVIMPTFNNSESLDAAITSVLQQKYTNIELIVIDDGSTDNTSYILKKHVHDRRLIIISIKQSGVAKARNIGLKRAKGKYIAYLDADNQWYPDFLVMMVNILEDKDHIDIGYCAEEVYRKDVFEKIRYKVFSRSFLENTNYIDINSVVHRRSLYDKYGGFDINLKRLEDWDLILRYTQQTYPVCVNCAFVKYFRSDHIKNPRKNLRNRNARLAYTISKKYIQNKIQKKPLTLNDVHNLLPSKVVSLYSNLKSIEITKEIESNTVLVLYCPKDIRYIDICLEAINKFPSKIKYKIAFVGNLSANFLKTIRSKYHMEGEVYSCKIDNKNPCIAQLHKIAQAVNDKYSNLVFTNCSIVVTEGWIDALIQAKNDNPDAEIIVPRLVVPPYSKASRKNVPLSNIEYETDITISVQKRNLKHMNPVKWENGYFELATADLSCALIARKAINKDPNKMKIIYTPHSKTYLIFTEVLFNSRLLRQASRTTRSIRGWAIYIWNRALHQMASI